MDRHLPLFPTAPRPEPCRHEFVEAEAVAGPFYRTLGIGEVHIDSWCSLCGEVGKTVLEFWRCSEDGHWSKL